MAAIHPWPPQHRETGQLPFHGQPHIRHQVSRCGQPQNGPLPGNIAGRDATVVVVVPEIVRPFLPGTGQVRHPKLGAGRQVEVGKVEGQSRRRGQVHRHGMVVREQRRGQVFGVVLHHAIQVLTGFFGQLVRAFPRGLDIHGLHFDHFKSLGQQGRRAGPVLGLGQGKLRNDQHGQQAGKGKSNHGCRFSPFDWAKAPKIRRLPGFIFWELPPLSTPDSGTPAIIFRA